MRPSTKPERRIRDTPPGSPSAAAAAPDEGPWRWTLLAAAAIVAAGALAYGNTFGVPFLFDDIPSIVENPTIQHLWPVWQAFCPPSTVARRSAAGRC